MAVNLSTHSKAINEAYQEVLDERSATDWALFGYEGKTNNLKVVDKGDDGLPGLSDSFSDAAVQYAFARVKDKKTDLFKFVFISYCGEGAPSNRKGDLAAHVEDIKRLFKGYHVVHNARREADVEVDVIMDKVATASGADYSAHREKERPAAAESTGKPVSSVYQKPEIISGNARNFKTRFEGSSAEEETQRKMEEERAARAAQEQEERERARQRDEREAQARRASADRESQAQKSAAENRRKQEEEQRRRDAEERRRREEAEDAARAAEEEQRRLEEEQASAAAYAQEPAATEEYAEATGQTGEEEGPTAQALYDYDAGDETEISFREGDYLYHIKEIDAGWWTGMTQDGKEGMFPSNYVQLLE